MNLNNLLTPAGWRWIKIGDICETVSVGFVGPTSEHFCEPGNGVPLIRLQNIRPGKLVLDDMAWVTKEFHAANKKSQSRGGDVLITRVGANAGDVCIVPHGLGDIHCSGAVFARAFPKYQKYLELFLRSPLGQMLLKSKIVGSVSERINTKSVEKLEILVPPDGGETSIAKFFTSFDDKIELNRQVNQTLEQIAQTIFKSWFVDFEPVKAKIVAKAAGRDPERAAICAISGKLESELDQLPPELYQQLAATTALFPDALVESELGLIPEGWNAIPFGSLLTHSIGGDWGLETPDSTNNIRVAIIRGTDLPDMDGAQTNRVPIRYTSQKKLENRQLQVGDIVLEVSGGSKDQPTGRSIRITRNALSGLDCPVEPASFCRLLRPVDQATGCILGLHLAYIYMQGKTWEYQNQSTGIANFQTAHFLEAELVVKPTPDVAECFYQQVNPMMELRHDSQSRQLSLIRDTLLPKLLSGEIEINDVAYGD